MEEIRGLYGAPKDGPDQRHGKRCVGTSSRIYSYAAAVHTPKVTVALDQHSDLQAVRCCGNACWSSAEAYLRLAKTSLHYRRNLAIDKLEGPVDTWVEEVLHLGDDWGVSRWKRRAAAN